MPKMMSSDLFSRYKICSCGIKYIGKATTTRHRKIGHTCTSLPMFRCMHCKKDIMSYEIIKHRKLCYPKICQKYWGRFKDDRLKLAVLT